MTKAKFTSHSSDSVTVEYVDDFSGEKNCRTFIKNGSYVYELVGMNAHQHQVCENLSSRGVTLMCVDGQDFADKIRAEYRKMRTADKKARV